jgi:hypothetical protein
MEGHAALMLVPDRQRNLRSAEEVVLRRFEKRRFE